MKKNLLLSIYVISLLAPWNLCWGENPDFRYAKWGMTQKEVIAFEDKLDPVEKTENRITYKTKILNKNVELNYLFAQNKLIGASYKLDDNYLNSNHFISTYLQFKQILTKKYGRQSKEITNWIDDTYRDNREKWGLALSLGHTEYATFWKTQNTTIECSLREENFNISCLIKYWSIEFSHLSESIYKEDKIDPF
jgi:hypothetical protein